MSPGAEAEHSHLGGVNLPLAGIVPDKPDRALGVFERSRITVRGYPILEDKGGHAMAVKPACHVHTFITDC